MADQNQSNTTFHLAGRVDATSMPEEGQQAASNTAEQQDQPEAASRALERENMNRAMTAKEEKAISTTMQCGKCKQERVAYTQAQTHSADEPMTTFCECTVCGNRWKFS